MDYIKGDIETASALDLGKQQEDKEWLKVTLQKTEQRRWLLMVMASDAECSWI